MSKTRNSGSQPFEKGIKKEVVALSDGSYGSLLHSYPPPSKLVVRGSQFCCDKLIVKSKPTEAVRESGSEIGVLEELRQRELCRNDPYFKFTLRNLITEFGNNNLKDSGYTSLCTISSACPPSP